MKMSGSWKKDHSGYKYAYNCGDHMRFGKTLCFSHFISAETLEEIVLGDIRDMAQRIILDEETVRKEFMQRNVELEEKAMKSARKELQSKRKRTEELSRLIQAAYENKVLGKIPEAICISFIEKYSAEQNSLEAEIKELERQLSGRALSQPSGSEQGQFCKHKRCVYDCIRIFFVIFFKNFSVRRRKGGRADEKRVIFPHQST